MVDLRQQARPAEPPPPARPWLRYALPALGIGLPTLVVLLYTTLVASPRYTARAELTVRSLQAAPAIPALALGGAGLSLGGGDQDGAMLATYLQSADLLNRLDAAVGVRAHWSDPSRDAWSRLDPDAGIEEALGHFRARSRVQVHPETGIISVELQGYDPVFTKDAADAMLRLAETAVNDLGHAVVRDRLGSFEQEVAKAEAAMRGAAAALLAFQGQTSRPDARGEAQAGATLVAGLDGELARERATLAALLATLGEQAEGVIAARARMAALQEQRDAIVRRLVESGGIGAQVVRQSELELDVQARTQAYQAALAAREQARVELGGKLKRLVVIDPPFLPEQASQPRAIYATITTLVVAALLYLVISLTVATIREHRD